MLDRLCYTLSMAKNKKMDVNLLASSIVEQATTIDSEISVNFISGKNPNAVALGRLGGIKGGKARAQKLTAEQRREIAKKASSARWEKKAH
jgi:hypothetical protein